MKDLHKKNLEEERSSHAHFFHHLDRSAILMVGGIIFLFSFSIIVVLVAPSFVDSTWVSPSSPYQVQMYEVVDPNYYISSVSTKGSELQYVNHLKQNFTLLAFRESKYLRILAPPELERYVTRDDQPELKLTSRVLMLRRPTGAVLLEAEKLQQELEQSWENHHDHISQKQIEKVKYQILEIYDPQVQEAFSIDPSGGFYKLGQIKILKF